MAARYDCPECSDSFEVATADEAIKRAAAHNHDHHGGPAQITPELEAALRANITES